MSDINLIGESIEFEQLLNENYTDTMVRGEYLIPDTHPDVIKILMIDARPYIINTEVMQDKVYVEGQVEYNVLYFAKEEERLAVNSISYNDKFNSQIDIGGAEHRMICEAECEVEHINANIINERKISVDGIFNIKCSLYENKKIDMVKDIDSTENVQMKKQHSFLDKVVGSLKGDMTAKSSLQLSGEKPEIGKVLRILPMLHKKEIKVLEGKVQCSAFCKIDVFYKAPEGSEVNILEDDIYISEEFDMESALPNMTALGEFLILTPEYGIREDDTGERRILDIEIPVKVRFKVVSKENMDIIEDAYCPKLSMDLDKQKHELIMMLGQNTTETIVKDNLYLDAQDSVPSQIISVSGKVFIIDKKIIENKVLIEGIIKADVIYRSSEENSNIALVSGEIPFNTAVEIPGLKIDMIARIKSNIESLDGDIEANTIALKAVINTNCRAFYKTSRDFLTDIKYSEDFPMKKSSITIYVVQPGDNIWNVAKKYYITQEELISVNGIEPTAEIKAGDKLLIPGRAIM